MNVAQPQIAYRRITTAAETEQPYYKTVNRIFMLMVLFSLISSHLIFICLKAAYNKSHNNPLFDSVWTTCVRSTNVMTNNAYKVIRSLYEAFPRWKKSKGGVTVNVFIVRIPVIIRAIFQRLCRHYSLVSLQADSDGQTSNYSLTYRKM